MFQVFTHISLIEEQCKAQKKMLHQLRQSIVKKAFSGELVPQDPNDEPASILLERIKTEKKNQNYQNKKSRKFQRSGI